MQLQPSARFVKTLEGLAKAAGLFAALIGVLVLAGWFFKVDLLKSISPRLAPMNPMSAVAFICLGLSLWLLQPSGAVSKSKLRFGRGLASIAIFIGGAKFISYFSDIDIEIDQWLFHKKVLHGPGGVPNEMSPNSALSFILMGFSLLLLEVEMRARFRPAQVLALAAGLISMVALIGYAYRVLALYEVGSFIPMPLNSAAVFFVTSLGVLAARPDRGWMQLLTSESTGGTIVRRLLPAAILIPIALGALRLMGERKGLYDTEFGISLFVISNVVIFTGLIWWNARLLDAAEADRIRAAQAVRKSEQRFRHVMEDSFDGMRLTDAEGKMLVVNKSFCQMVDMPEEKLIGQPFTVIYAPERREDLLGKYKQRFNKHAIETRFSRETHLWNGKKIWLELSNTFLELEGEEPQLLSIFRDVTERKLAEAALEHERHLLKTLMDNVPDRIYFKDLQSRFLRNNRAQARRFGLSDPSEVVGKTDFDFFSEEHARRAFENEQEIIRTGEPFNKEEKLTSPDGQVSWSMTTKLPLRDEHGTIVGTFGISRDVTQRKRAEEELKNLAEQLREKNTQMEADFEMAREIQEVFLPNRYPTFPRSVAPKDSALQFYHRYEPAAAVGGDFFDVFAITDTMAGIFICDVMGHGMRAALITAILRGLVEELMPVAADPGKFLTEINRSLHAILGRTDETLLATACYIVMDTTGKEMRFSTAGHPSPLRVSRSANTAEPLSFYAPQHGPALGLFDNSIYPVCSCPVAADDLILLYTDGVYEVLGADGEEYGKERFFAAVRKRIQLPTAQICDEIMDEVRQFSSAKDFGDDVCLVAMDIAR